MSAYQEGGILAGKTDNTQVNKQERCSQVRRGRWGPVKIWVEGPERAETRAQTGQGPWRRGKARSTVWLEQDEGGEDGKTWGSEVGQAPDHMGCCQESGLYLKSKRHWWQVPVFPPLL